MDITIQPVNNGWLVEDRTNKTRTVFIDREKMIEYLNDIIPPTTDQQEFVDNIDGVEDDEKEVEDDGKIFEALFDSLGHSKGVRSRKRLETF